MRYMLLHYCTKNPTTSICQAIPIFWCELRLLFQPLVRHRHHSDKSNHVVLPGKYAQSSLPGIIPTMEFQAWPCPIDLHILSPKDVNNMSTFLSFYFNMFDCLLSMYLCQLDASLAYLLYPSMHISNQFLSSLMHWLITLVLICIQTCLPSLMNQL